VDPSPRPHMQVSPVIASHDPSFWEQVGAYNRANRSVHHMVENFGAFVAGMFMVGTVFPFPTFVLACIFCIGRVLHQVGYATGYGSHGKGFLLAFIAQSTMDGLAMVVWCKA